MPASIPEWLSPPWPVHHAVFAAWSPSPLLRSREDAVKCPAALNPLQRIARRNETSGALTLSLSKGERSHFDKLNESAVWGKRGERR